MPERKEPAELLYTWWERFLNAQSEAWGGDREFSQLSTKLDEVRRGLFADGQLSETELATLAAKMEAVAALHQSLSARTGAAMPLDAGPTLEAFRNLREAAEIHFQTFAGDDQSNYRGGLLGDLLRAADPAPVLGRLVLDLVSSASPAIARDKVSLLRAQLSLLGDGARQSRLLAQFRDTLERELRRPVWSRTSRGAAISLDVFDRGCVCSSVVATEPLALPEEVRGNNRMLPNHPIAGRDSACRAVVERLLGRLRAERRLFLDDIAPSGNAVRVCLKVELNLGIEGPPSVTDPASTYAVIATLLAWGAERGVALQFTVGDSNGIENAPAGRTSLDVLRDTGNYHAALKAALEFAAQSAPAEDQRRTAAAELGKLLACESATPAVYFGSHDGHAGSAEERARMEAAAAPWVICVDYDQAGFRAIEPNIGPLGQAIWGSKRFHIAEPWAAADYRVHVTRGVSTHLFAGWTGALKGLIGLHALGGRPGDHGMRMRGESAFEILNAILASGSFTGLFARRAGVDGFAALAAGCTDESCRQWLDRCESSWSEVVRLGAGRSVWAAGAAGLNAELWRDREAGRGEIELMAKMRHRGAVLLEQAEQASPGFRRALWQGVADGTRAFLLTMWRLRDHLPAGMRDERMGLRIGLLSQLPQQADLVVQSLPKIGIGGGPDAYFEVRDCGVVVAGSDEMSVDLGALRAAGIPGNPWAFHHPLHGALQFGRGPMSWEDIRTLTP